jgi:hypothetical protein
VEYPGNSLKIALGILGVSILEIQVGLFLSVPRRNPPALSAVSAFALGIAPYAAAIVNVGLICFGFAVAIRDAGRGCPPWATSLACVILMLAAAPTAVALLSSLK